MTQQGRGGLGAPTLEAVAAAAGVSRATASRVLRGSSKVSDQARDAVLRAAEALSYRPNRAARSLVTGRSESIAFVVSESEERMFSEPFFLGMLRSAHAAAADVDYQLMLTVISTPEARKRFIDYAAGGHVDGALLLSVHGHDDMQEQLEAAGVPTILSGRPPHGVDGLYYVDADNVAGGRLATEHLIRSGRKVIGTVTGQLDMCAGQDRLAGYQSALREAGRACEDSLVVPGGFSTAEGFAGVEELLARRPDVDGIVMASDLAAIGAIRALQRHGRQVPEVAVVGFDDIRDAADHHPPLTTVRQPVAELGATMTRILFERLDDKPPERFGIKLPVELVLRESA